MCRLTGWELEKITICQFLSANCFPMELFLPPIRTSRLDVSAGIKQQHFHRFCSSKEQTHWRGRGTHSTSVSKLLV